MTRTPGVGSRFASGTSPTTIVRMALTLEQFGKSIIAAGLLSSDELRAWYTTLAADRKPRDVETFAARLVEDGKITHYQSQVLLQSKGSSLTFGNYLLTNQLGVGATGYVFQAKHKVSGRLVAIKVLSKEIAADDKALKRFQREIQAAGRLAHPNIVQSFDAGELNGQHYLVMEFVDGSDLTTIVKERGVYTPAAAIHAIKQAATGLQYAHEQGVIHRDIKPRNLLQDKNGGVRLLDMGLVRLSDGGDSLTATQQVMGTIDYMSPEQALDPKKADVRSDIYSLGCTLWFLLTGKKLYDAKGVVDRIMLHRSAPIPLLMKEQSVPKELQAVFEKMVAKRPEDRFQTMTEVIAALDVIGKPAAAVIEVAASPVEELAEVEMVSEQSLMNLPKAPLATVAISEPPANANPFAINVGGNTPGRAGTGPVINPTAAKGKASSQKPAASPEADKGSMISRLLGKFKKGK